MKNRLLFSSMMLLLMASAAIAQTGTQSGPLGGAVGVPVNSVVGTIGSTIKKVPILTGDDHPAKPVPEPGTMALASMGLIALGAAARRRRK